MVMQKHSPARLGCIPVESRQFRLPCRFRQNLELMIHSMTAFARRERETEAGTLVCELRSVNHRHLELALRLPEELRLFEPQVRELAAARLSRGKLDVSMKLQAAPDAASALRLDETLIRQIIEADASIRRLVPDAVPLRSVDLLRWPGALTPAPVDSQRIVAAAATL